MAFPSSTGVKKIVVLDGHALNPGDLDWGPLAAFGPFTVHDRSTTEEALVRAAGADVVFVNKTALDRATLERLPGLRYIGVLATGYNVVDVAAARACGVAVTNVPAYGTRSVAQLTIALLLELANRVGLHAASVAAGDWSRSRDFCYWKTPLVELAGLTFGVVGYGRIGRDAAAVARALGMEVIAHSRRDGARTADDGTPLVGLEELLGRSDVVSLHCPLTAENTGMINRERLALMKPGAFLLNTGRGALIDEAALAEALRAGRLAGAGLDVLTTEPPPPGHPLIGLPNCLVTPHIAWGTPAARRRLIGIAADNLRSFLAGQPVNVVNA